MGNISYDLSEEQMIEIFGQVGPVLSFRYDLLFEFLFPIHLFSHLIIFAVIAVAVVLLTLSNNCDSHFY